MSDEATATMVFGLALLGLLAAGIVRIVWVALYDEYLGLASAADAAQPSRFEVVLKHHDGGPGRYRVRGVIPSIEADVVLSLDADSASGAGQKAAKAGVVVTDVTSEVWSRNA